MVYYAKNELVSSTQVAKQFGEYISKVKNGTVDKIGILKNNKLNAVIVSIDEYEKMSELLNQVEDEVIFKQIKNRLNTTESDYIDGNKVLEKYGLSVSN